MSDGRYFTDVSEELGASIFRVETTKFDVLSAALI